MALVAIKNLNSNDASTYLAEALQNGHPLLPIRRVAIWQELLHKNRLAAAKQIHELARVLAADKSMANRADYLESARWLGVVLSYYAGPGSADISAADRKALVADIEGQLNGPMATALADGEAALELQFKTLHDQSIAAHRDVKAKNTAKIADEVQKYDAQILDARTKGRDAETQLMQLRKEHNADEIERQYVPIKRQIDQLQKQQKDLETEKNVDDRFAKGDRSDFGPDKQRKLNSVIEQIDVVQKQLAPYTPVIQQIQSL